MVPTPASPPRPRIPDYELLRLIGSGSYGDVWLARGVTGVFRAVKIVWRDRFADVRPYAREFDGLTRFTSISLREPSQLALVHAGRSDATGYFFYVMELADDAERGRTIEPAAYVPLTLKELRARRGRMPASEVIALGVALARALGTLHAEGLVHRDIKPSNVVIVGGVPKLADIGLVTAASEGVTFVGTEGYVPPEGPGAPAADVYSLGKVLYEFATGLDRTDWPRLPPDFASTDDRKGFVELNEVLIRACASDPRQRFADASGLLDELLLLQAGKSVRRLRRAEHRIARALRVVALLAVVATVAGAGAWVATLRARDEMRRREQAEAERDRARRHAEYAATFAQAQSALEQRDFARARSLLRLAATHQPPGFEWRVLWHQSRAAGEVLREHGPAIDKLALSADGALLAVHDESKTVTLYDSATHRQVGTLPGIHRLAGVSADGRWLLGTNAQFTAQRWEISTGQADPRVRGGSVIRPFGARGDAIVGFVDGDAITGRPAALLLWDSVSARDLVHAPLSAPGEHWEFLAASMDPSRAHAVIACVRDPHNQVQFRLSIVPLDTPAAAVHAKSPLEPKAVGWLALEDGTATAWVADNAGNLSLWNASAREWQPASARLPAQSVLVIASSPGIQLVAHDNKISLVRGGSLVVDQTLHGHGGAVTSLLASADGAKVFSSSNTGELRSWNIPGSREAPRRHAGWNPRGNISRLAFSADAKRIYVPRDGRTVAILEASSLTTRGTVEDMRYAFAVTDQGVWGLSADGRSILCHPETTADAGLRLDGASPVLQAAVSGDGRIVSVVRAPGELWFTNVARPEAPVRVAGEFQQTWPLRLNRAGDTLWCYRNSDQQLLCVRLPSGRLAWRARLPAVAADVVLLSRAGLVAALLSNGNVHLHDAESGELRRVIFCGSGNPQGFIATPAGDRLLVADRIGHIHVIATDAWSYVGRISTGAAEALRSVQIAPDGSALAAITPDGVLHVLDAPAAP